MEPTGKIATRILVSWACVFALIASCTTMNPPAESPEIDSATTTPSKSGASDRMIAESELVAVEVVARVNADLLPDAPEMPPVVTDLISRLRQSLVFQHADDPKIDAQRNWFRKHPEYMNRVFTRSNRYLWFIMNEIEKRDMPMDLALLPIVESAYDPFAYSHGRAAGLWQFIPGTATRFGVRQNWWYDGRRDILDSTRAALDYLEYLHEEFDGDWQLAVAGYNSGEGNVHRAIRRNRSQGKPIDFWHLKLPRETSAYVPKLLALSQLVSDPEAYGLNLPELADAPYFETVEMDGQVDLAMLAEMSGVAIEEIYALNPGFNRWATDPDGPHRAVVPVEQAPVLRSALAETPSNARVRWVRHRIRPGDSLITIARQHDTTPAVLRQVNGIRGNLIRAGDFVMIPTATRNLAGYSMSADRRLVKTQNTPRDGQKVVHIVKPGDSFWELARRYDVPTRSLAKWNGMAPRDTLSVGKKLVIWTRADTSITTAGGPDGRLRKVRYTVRSGDSLYKISSRFKVSMSELKNWNNIDGKRYLQPGQKLVMYVDVTRQSGG